MTLDASAILAVLQDEAERTEFLSLIEQSSRRLISAVSVLEAGMILEGRRGDDAGSDLDLFLQRASIETLPFDQEQLAVARMAFRRFGKGRHAAGLRALETSHRMLLSSGRASHCCSNGAISRQPMWLAQGSDTSTCASRWGDAHFPNVGSGRS